MLAPSKADQMRTASGGIGKSTCNDCHLVEASSATFANIMLVPDNGLQQPPLLGYNNTSQEPR